MNATESHLGYFNIGSGSQMLFDSNNPLPELILTKISERIRPD